VSPRFTISKPKMDFLKKEFSTDFESIKDRVKTAKARIERMEQRKHGSH